MRPEERRNAIVYATGEGCWGLSMGFVAPLTVLPLIIGALGGGPVEIGLVFSIATAGFLLPQPLGMIFLQHGGGKKRFLILYHLVTALPTSCGIAAVIYFLSGARPALSRVLILCLFFIRTFAIGAVVPVWMDWVAGLYSRKSRGRAIGMAAAAAATGTSVTAIVAGWLSGKLPFHSGYALLFLLSTVCVAASMGAFSFVSAGTPPPGVRRLGIGELLAKFGHSLASVNFRNYLVARVLLTMGGGATAFFAVHYRSPEGGALTGSLVIALGTLLTLPQAVMSYWLGRIGDRSGHKRGVFIGAAAQMGAILVAVLARGPLSCALCFSLVGVATAAAWVSHLNMIYETCPHDNRVAHITLSNLVLSPFVMSIPLLTGWLISHLGRTSGMAISLVPTCLGVLWLLLRVREPRQVELPVETGTEPQ